MSWTPEVLSKLTRVFAGRMVARPEVGAIQKGHSAMMWRRLCLVRAVSAAGLVVASLGLGGMAQAQSNKPSSEPASQPVGVATETVDLLSASRSGDLVVTARGQGQDRVRISIQNKSRKRLNVVIPPGLVAASTVGQGAAGGGRGGLQSMGLGSITNREGGFGDFQAQLHEPGFKSVSVTSELAIRGLAVPVGQTIDASVPAVCLNFGLPSPTPRNKLVVMDVDDYTSNDRVRKALRGLATLGTSHGVAQAVMWNVCDNLSFEEMTRQAGSIMNPSEIDLARRFVDAIDASNAETVDHDTLFQGRILVRLQGEGKLAAEVDRISRKIDGTMIFGLPSTLLKPNALPDSRPALLLDVLIDRAKVGETQGRITVLAAGESLNPLARLDLKENSSLSVLDGDTLAKALERTVAAALVSVKLVKRSTTSTTLRITNRLPFSIASLVVRAGDSSGSPPVPFDALGIGPMRSMNLPIQAAGASVVERVVLNGL